MQQKKKETWEERDIIESVFNSENPPAWFNKLKPVKFGRDSLRITQLLREGSKERQEFEDHLLLNCGLDKIDSNRTMYFLIKLHLHDQVDKGVLDSLFDDGYHSDENALKLSEIGRIDIEKLSLVDGLGETGGAEALKIIFDN